MNKARVTCDAIGRIHAYGFAASLSLFALTAYAAPPSYSYQEGDVLPSVSVVDGETGSVRVGGTLQFWTIPYLGNEARLQNGDPADSEGFRMRRARLGIRGEYERFVSFNLTLDGLASPGLYEAYLDYRPLSEIGLTLGSAKVPYSRYQLDSSSTMRFYDRPMATGEVAMNHRLGASLSGSAWGTVLSYVAGVYNPSDSPIVSERRGILYAGRIESAPLGSLAQWKPNEFRIRLGGGALWENTDTMDTLAYSGDVAIEGYGIQIRSEFLYDTRTPESDPEIAPTLNAEVHRRALVQQITGFIWTHLELGFRYENYDSNTALEDFGDAEQYVGTLNIYFYEHNLKALLTYIHRPEDEALARDNDAVLLVFGGSI